MKKIFNLLVVFLLVSCTIEYPQERYLHKDCIIIDTIYVDTVHFTIIVLDTVYVDTTQISVENIYAVCDELCIHNKEIVAAQGILESANFESSLFKRTNNFLGLYNSTTKQYYVFDHWSQCLIAYKKFIQNKYNISKENYYTFLEEIGYAEDSMYISKIDNILNTLE